MIKKLSVFLLVLFIPSVVFASCGGDMIPTMSSNTAPSGEASASTIYNATYDAWKAMEDANGYWNTQNGIVTGWLQYAFDAGVTKVVDSYSIKARTSGDFATASPKTWTFLGSNTGAFGGEETTLDTRTNVPAWSAGEERTYSFANTTGYRYYRWNITLNQGGTQLNINEVQMFGCNVEGRRVPTAKSVNSDYMVV